MNTKKKYVHICITQAKNEYDKVCTHLHCSVCKVLGTETAEK